MKTTAVRVLKGLASYIPGAYANFAHEVACASSAEQCLRIWSHHLRKLDERHIGVHGKTVVELGPGGSIGVGLAALLSGAAAYIGLDAVRLCETERELAILDEMVRLFQNRVDVVGYIVTEDVLRESLDPKRLDVIRQELSVLSERNGQFVSYYAPQYCSSTLEPETADIIFSHAVMEYVDDLEGLYKILASWLKPGGVMQHEIDFRSSGMADTWDGHRAYPDLLWRLIRGKRPYMINRAPLSTHLELAQAAGLEVIGVSREAETPTLRSDQLAPRFTGLSEEELSTAKGFFQARKPASL